MTTTPAPPAKTRDLTWSEMLDSMRAIQSTEPVIPPPRVIYEKADKKRLELFAVTRSMDV